VARKAQPSAVSRSVLTQHSNELSAVNEQPDETNRRPGFRGEHPTPPVAGGQVLSSAELLGSGGEVLIAHEGSMYRLRRTLNGKLILSK
jgi:hemin uptake protein HemP